MAEQGARTKAATPGGDAADEKSPEQIEAEIEATRQELGDTAAELADKADLKKQAKKKVADTKVKAAAKTEELKQKATTQAEAAKAKVTDAAPDSSREGVQGAVVAGPQQARAQAAEWARENPVHAAASGAFVGGLVIGWMLARR